MMRGLKKILFIALMLFQAVASSQELQRANKDTAALSGKIEEVTISAFRSPNNLFNCLSTTGKLTK